MNFVIHEYKGRDEWLADRRKYLCATDVPVVMGVEKAREWRRMDDPTCDPVVSLWREKVKGREIEAVSIPARMGQALEPLVLELYCELTGNVAQRPYKWAHGLHVINSPVGRPHFKGWAASLDAEGVDKATGEMVIVECKTGMYGAGNWALAYEWQCRWQMMVTDYKRVDIACLHKAKADFHVEQVLWDADKEKEMLAVALEFAAFVSDKKEPPQSWIDARVAGF